MFCAYKSMKRWSKLFFRAGVKKVFFWKSHFRPHMSFFANIAFFVLQARTQLCIFRDFKKKTKFFKNGWKLCGICWCDEKFSWKNGAIHCHYLMFSYFFAKFRKNRAFLFTNRNNQQKKSFFSHQQMNSYLGASIIDALGNINIFGKIPRTGVKKYVFFFGTQTLCLLLGAFCKTAHKWGIAL